jgi:hypothetical protein
MRTKSARISTGCCHCAAVATLGATGVGFQTVLFITA